MNDQKVTDDTRVRVGVKGGGCSGFSYDWSIKIVEKVSLI